jgi:hypothetical protein
VGQVRTIAAIAFPVFGCDALALGLREGPELGRLLDAVEAWWAERNSAPSCEDCLERLKELIAATWVPPSDRSGWTFRELGRIFFPVSRKITAGTVPRRSGRDSRGIPLPGSKIPRCGTILADPIQESASRRTKMSRGYPSGPPAIAPYLGCISEPYEENRQIRPANLTQIIVRCSEE